MNTNQIAPFNLIVLRGLPGAGKSTLAQLLAQGQWPIFSIDDYFTDPVTNVYEFRYADNHLAYKACEQATETAMQNKTPTVLVHNTFTLEWEMEPYFKMALAHNYRVHVLTVENRHGSQNIHGIGTEQLSKMAAKYHVKLY